MENIENNIVYFIKLHSEVVERKAGKLPLVIREFFIDEGGLNKLVTHSTDKTIVIFLKLHGEKNRKRKIGNITKSTKTIKIKRNRELHLYRNGNAYGFNEYVFRTAKQFDSVWLHDEHSDWTFPVSFLLDSKNGFYLHHQQQGFELQKFLGLGELEPFRVLPKENRRF